MADPVTMAVGGAALGGLLDKKNPLRGAALGGLGGYFAGPALGLAGEGASAGAAGMGGGTGLLAKEGAMAGLAPNLANAPTITPSFMGGMGLKGAGAMGGMLAPEGLAFAAPGVTGITGGMAGGLGSGLTAAEGALTPTFGFSRAMGSITDKLVNNAPQIGMQGLKMMNSGQQPQQQPSAPPPMPALRQFGQEGPSEPFVSFAPGQYYGLPTKKRFSRG